MICMGITWIQWVFNAQRLAQVSERKADFERSGEAEQGIGIETLNSTGDLGTESHK